MRWQVGLMALTVLLTRLWELFHPQYKIVVKFWAYFGLDVTKKYDLFLFTDHEQHLHWYAQYTNYLLTITILCYLIYKLSYNKVVRLASKVLLFFSIFRVISYWLFRGSIEFEILCIAVATFLILIIPKWRPYFL